MGQCVWVPAWSDLPGWVATPLVVEVYDQGSYEPRNSRFLKGVAETLAETGVTLLKIWKYKQEVKYFQWRVNYEQA